LKRRRRRKIIAIVVLVLLLALLGAWYWNYTRTRSLGVQFAPPNPDALPAPTYLFSFSGSQDVRLVQPIGLTIENGKVYVTDAALGYVMVFDTKGKLLSNFGKGKLKTPLNAAYNPVNGNIYVSDRGLKQVRIFTPAGMYVGVFDPKLPKSELPTFDTKGFQWEPIALGFAPDGSLYVTEIQNGHRVLFFDKNGKFVRSVGRAGFVTAGGEAPGVFQFPNGLVVNNNLIYIADSNNRRVQVYDLKGNFKQFVITGGLPRGIAFLNKVGIVRGTDKFVTADTLSHDGTIWTVTGKKVVSFGSQGLLEGQFNYPNQVSVDPNNQIFVVDTQNSRVQVWGWPTVVPVVIPPILAQNWPWCLTPLLLLLPLLRRRRKFLASRDFVLAMVERELVENMPARRRKWLVMQDDYEALKDICQGEVRLSELLEPTEYSESDTKALQERLEVSLETAAMLSVAQRVFVFCTEDIELRRLAKLLETDVANVDEFMERFGPQTPKDSSDDGHMKQD
jgi:DNA-binding beta-propeller fold protein YncE